MSVTLLYNFRTDAHVQIFSMSLLVHEMEVDSFGAMSVGDVDNPP